MIRSPIFASGLIALSFTCVAEAGAHAITLVECREGGEFIRNAALARDAGVTRDFFIGKLEEDLMLIRAFPPQLRWFVQDEADEQFLSERAEQVFDAPRQPEEHETAFVRDCLLQSASMDQPA
jgi:hypothetical protein